MEQILLVEDDVATSDWLNGLLLAMPGGQSPARCFTAQTALHWLEKNQPDIVLADLGLPDGSGIDVIREATRRYPDCDVLVITVFGDEAHVMAALSAGASGYLIKDASLSNMHEHLAHLRMGGSPMTPRIARMLIRQYRSSHTETPSPALAVQTTAQPTQPLQPLQPEQLSAREVDVLTGIAKGFSYLEVATALAVSTNTVRTHIKRIYQKLAVNSRSEAVYEFNQLQAQRGKPPLL
jgi:DNA-binding NarL/FixJ family response regulator